MKVFVSLVVLLGCVNVATSLKCYSCSTITDSNCGDPIKKDALADKIIEVAEGGVCTKSKLSAAKSDAIVSRGTSPTADAVTCPDGKNGCKSSSAGGLSGTQCCCTGDLCNGAAGLHQNSFILFAIISGVLMVVNRFY